MKNYFFLLFLCLLFLFQACKPDFDLNASYKDVPVVYGIFDIKDSIHYIKIYKGYQSNGNVFVDAKNPDSIYYAKDDITVVLQEYQDDKFTGRTIPFVITHDFPRDSGMFYYDKERIIYRNEYPEKLSVDMNYKLRIENKNGNIVEGTTPIVGEFSLNMYPMPINMLAKSLKVPFRVAKNATNGYEIHVIFRYFEVNKITNEVVKIDKIVKNIGPKLGIEPVFDQISNYYKQEYLPTFYDDIAGLLKVDNSVVRYAGAPSGINPNSCIEIEGWAAAKDLVNFLLSNQPTSGFVQINYKYTNLTATDSLAFGVLSSKTRCETQLFTVSETSIDSLVRGSKTRHLGFRSRDEYKP